MTALDRVTDRLRELASTNSGDMRKFPAHDDRARSLAVGQGKVGVTLLCHAGCPAEAIIEALGVPFDRLFDDPAEGLARDLCAPECAERERDDR